MESLPKKRGKKRIKCTLAYAQKALLGDSSKNRSEREERAMILRFKDIYKIDEMKLKLSRLSPLAQ